MIYKLKQPWRVGDFKNWVDVDEFEVKSISLTFDPQSPTLSVVLVHTSSDWQHNVVYRDSTVVEFWARAFEAEFNFLHKVVMQKLIADKQLPEGDLIEEKT